MFVEVDVPPAAPRLPLGMFELHCDPHPGQHAQSHERHYDMTTAWRDFRV